MKFLFLVATLPLFSATVLAYAGAAAAGAAGGYRSNAAFKDFSTPAPQGMCRISVAEKGYSYFNTVENGNCQDSFFPIYPETLIVQGNGGAPSIKIFTNAGCTEKPAGVGQDTLNVGGNTPVGSMLITC